MAGPSKLRITDRDLRLLAFMGEHKLVLERQLEVLLGVGPDSLRKRLGQLAGAGYLERLSVLGQLPCCRIRRAGLAAIGSPLKPPRLKLLECRHDIGAAWLWLAAWRGTFGPVADVIGEPRLRAHDTKVPEEPYSIRLGGHDRHGHPQRHYPDLLLVDPHDRRLALELELSPKERPRWERILAGYGADRRVDGVIYLVEANRLGRSIGGSIQSAATEMGLTGRVSVRPMTPIGPAPPGSDFSQTARRATRRAAEAVL